MVATYKDGWNKEDYISKGETYHTAFSDYRINYEIPENLTLVSTSDNELVTSPSKGQLEANNVKDFFIAILKDPNVIEKEINNINIRVFGIDNNKKLHKEVGDISSEALNYFEEKIGPYPHGQLDIIVDQSGMEYPGIITVGSIYNKGSTNPSLIKSIVVHEIAHQWFYGVVSNDPYNDAWLDEGITELATLLFHADYRNEEISLDVELFKDFPLPVNLPLDKYDIDSQSNYIYGKSTTYLWDILTKNDGRVGAEEFLKNYYNVYKYKDVDTQEFVRYIKYYLNMKDDNIFKEFLLLEE
ncbi:M1 family metallopeptidase [Oceanobacillus caeni]|uniref:M1 family metallopeptidase n=1 Tax=Bacillaceae TaxID=186817 RepID=UPI0011A4DEDF|nr:MULTISPECIES: M1 family metallopeptidase [Bacillaceae]MBU8791783.1 hypothetical protein [Oceanobacillus caeni]